MTLKKKSRKNRYKKKAPEQVMRCLTSEIEWK